MAEEVRKFSLTTILKIVKRSGPLLGPHLADIIGALLESLSELEPQVMSMISHSVKSSFPFFSVSFLIGGLDVSYELMHKH